MGEWAVRVGEPYKPNKTVKMQVILRLYIAVCFWLGGMSSVTARCWIFCCSDGYVRLG